MGRIFLPIQHHFTGGTMAGITDGIGPSLAATSVIGRRDAGHPSSPSNRTDRVQSGASVDANEVGRFGDLARLYEERGHVWAEAVKVRQLDRKLERVADRAGEVQAKLDLVKLYPPYPIDEPRRAEAIREFNGLAAEVRRMVSSGDTPDIDLAPLSSSATTAEAERATAAAGQVSRWMSDQRAALSLMVESPTAGAAEAESMVVGSGLSASGASGISRRVTNLLWQVA